MLEITNIRPVTIVLLLAFVFASARRLMRKTTKGSLPLPPGPPKLPIVGNALDIDANAPWLTYTKWGETYGDIIHSRLLSQDIIIINSEKVAKDLLERRSSNYSDRPVLITTEIFGWMFNAAFLRYGDSWRQHRRLFNEQLRAAAALSYRPTQMQKTHQMLVDILQSPIRLAHHLQAMTASTIMSIAYGYDTETLNDPLVTVIEDAMSQGFEITTPEASAILTEWPLLLYLPSWFPGAGFKRRARKCLKVTTEMIDRPFQYTKGLLDSDNARACMVTDLLNRTKDEGNSDELEKVIKSVASTSVVGASETTTSTLLDFVLAMMHFPHVQERAHAEIASVIGNDRLPGFEDRYSLPYVEAVVRESHRWHPVLPLGVAHAAVNDDVYEGLYIPKGATVVANTWAMSRNEAKYPNASEFIPERFFTADGKLNDDRVLYVFGFGRRICIGQYVADAAVWAAIVSLLAAFKFSKMRDERGREVEVDMKWTPGMAVRPRPFPCHIEPRVPGMTVEKLQQMISHFG